MKNYILIALYDGDGNIVSRGKWGLNQKVHALRNYCQRRGLTAEIEEVWR